MLPSASLLQSVTLRKTIPNNNNNNKDNNSSSTNSSSPSQKSLSQAVDDEKSLYNRLRAVDIEQWYTQLKEFTYHTEFIPLTQRTAQAMIHRYWSIKRDESKEKELFHHKTFESPEDTIVLNDFQKSLEEAIQKIPYPSRGVFSKLSSRSPKDSRKQMDKALKKAEETLCTMRDEKKTVTHNDICCVIMSSSIETLRCDSASDVLLAFCTSDRVCEDDLPLALSFPSVWSQHVVIRQWHPVPIHMEFRGFVFNNTLTAICQYFNDGVFSELIEQKEKILTLIQHTFDKMKSLVPIDPKEYVIDFVVDLSLNVCFVIELNPFGRPNGMGTGTVMFDNQNEKDLKVLFGEAPQEFRIENEWKGPLVLRDPWKSMLLEKGFVKMNEQNVKFL